MFTPRDITHFYHRYVNQKLHTLQYDKAINILKVFEQLDNLDANSSLIIDDRYCVAFYSLGLEKEALEKEKNLQKATLKIKQKYGKNAIVRGMNLKEGATAMDRNRQIGGHHE